MARNKAMFGLQKEKLSSLMSQPYTGVDVWLHYKFISNGKIPQPSGSTPPIPVPCASHSNTLGQNVSFESPASVRFNKHTNTDSFASEVVDQRCELTHLSIY